MKKLLIAVTVVTFALSACGNKNKLTKEDESSVDEFTRIAQQVKNEHNAQNSLDYVGTYSGKLPTASGEGMNVTIVLGNDDSYTKTIEYIDKKDRKFDEKGKYSWNEAGNTVTLNGAERPNQYFVGENTLTQLDIEGKRITGELGDMYVLRK